MRHVLRLISIPRLMEHPFRSFLTIVGIALGVAANIAVQMILATMTDSFSSMIDAVSGKVQLQISGGEAGVAEEIYDRIQIRDEQGRAPIPGVAAAMPTIQNVTKYGTENVLILAVDTLNDRAARDYRMTDSEGAEIEDPLAFLNAPNTLLLNREFAKRFNIAVDDTIDLMTSTGKKPFVVKGLLDASGPASAFGGNFALMDVYAAQLYFGREKMFDSIDLLLEPDANVEAVKAAAESWLAGAYEVRRPEQRNQGVESLLRSMNMGLSIMTLVVMAMGGFIIFNTMTTSVYQRLREIGILRMIGVTRTGIWNVVAAEALILGVLGAAGGIAGGFLLGRFTVLHYIGKVTSLFIPANTTHAVFRPEMIATGTAMGLGITLLGALWPAWRATRITPLQVLRFGPGLAGGRQTNLARWTLAAAVAFAFTLVLALHPRFHTIDGIRGAMMFMLFVGVGATPLFMYLVLRLIVPMSTWLRSALSRMAAENLMRDLGRSSMTVAAFMVALAVLFEIYLFMGSMRAELKAWMDNVLKADVYITSSNNFATRTSVPMDPSMTDKLRSVPGIEHLVEVRLKLQDFKDSRIVLLGVNFAAYIEKARIQFPDEYDAEAVKRLVNNEGVMLSQNLVSRHPELKNATHVTLDTPHGRKDFPILSEVVDYTSETGTILFNRPLFIENFNDALVDTYHVYIQKGVDTQEIRRRIDAIVGDNFNLFVLTNREFKSSIIEAIDQVFGLAVALEIVALAIALIGIVNNLLSNVIDRTREIGVLRSLGATKAQIRRIFLAQSAIMGFCGACVGAAAGWGIGIIHLKRLSIILSGWTMAVHFSAPVIACAFVFSVAFAASAGLIPAAKAANLQLREALKYE